jgi:hypothetical protein
MDWVRRHAMVDIEREFPAVVWQMAVDVMHQFVEACRGQLSYKNDSLSFTLNLRTEPEHNGVGSLREKYTIFYFNEMGHYNWDVKERTLLNPEQMVHEQYRRLIPGLLEGVIIRGKSSYYYPSHTCGYIEEMVAANMSSWQNELCILTDQSALIYPHMPRQGHQVVFPSQHLAYTKYWECILRALEFGVESRLLVQLAKQMTSTYLADALLFLRKDSIVAQQDLRSFDFKAANAARLLSHLRTITAPHIIAQANYSVNKLQMFLQQTGVPQVLSHAETNLNDLSNLVERSHELSLQRESQRSNELALGLSVIFGGLTFGLAILALPSFIVDWEAENGGFLSRRWYYSFLPYLGEVLVLCLAFLGLVMFVLAFISLIHRLSRRRTEGV